MSERKQLYQPIDIHNWFLDAILDGFLFADLVVIEGSLGLSDFKAGYTLYIGAMGIGIDDAASIKISEVTVHLKVRFAGRSIPSDTPHQILVIWQRKRELSRTAYRFNWNLSDTIEPICTYIIVLFSLSPSLFSLSLTLSPSPISFSCG